MIELSFSPAPSPQTPQAVVAIDDAVGALLAAALDRDDDELSKLEGIGDASSLVLFAATPDALPWSPGCIYLAAAPTAPSLWLPTTLSPSISPALIAGALRRGSHGLSSSTAVVVVDGDRHWISLDARRPVSRVMLARLQKLVV